MKVKLLKKLRQRGRSQISIHSVTKTNGVVAGMGMGYSEDAYSELFYYGDTEDEVLNLAARIYLKNNIGTIRQRYRKHSVKYRSNKRRTNY